MDKVIARIIGEILDNMSPIIRSKVLEFLNKLEIDAKATPNPWDDLAVRIAKAIIGN